MFINMLISFFLLLSLSLVNHLFLVKNRNNSVKLSQNITYMHLDLVDLIEMEMICVIYVQTHIHIHLHYVYYNNDK